MLDRKKCHTGVRTTLKFMFGLYERICHSEYEDTLTHSMIQGNSGCFDIFLTGKDKKNCYDIRKCIVIFKESVASLTRLLSVKCVSNCTLRSQKQ
jgi:hypothetical protein